MKKGYLILGGSLLLLAIAGIVTIRVLASQYEKRPKQPGEAELWAAETFIRAYEESESSGNTPEAMEFAEQFSRSLRVSRQYMFTEGKAGAKSFTQGRFLTYCFLSEDSAAILVHVPELRRYSNDAKLTLEEFAWSLASSYAASKHPEVTELAVGIKGALNYSSIITGTVDDEAPLKAIESRHPTTSAKPLWPYFLTPTTSEQSSEEKNVPQPVDSPSP